MGRGAARLPAHQKAYGYLAYADPGETAQAGDVAGAYRLLQLARRHRRAQTCYHALAEQPVSVGGNQWRYEW